MRFNTDEYLLVVWLLTRQALKESATQLLRSRSGAIVTQLIVDFKLLTIDHWPLTIYVLYTYDYRPNTCWAIARAQGISAQDRNNRYSQRYSHRPFYTLLSQMLLISFCSIGDFLSPLNCFFSSTRSRPRKGVLLSLNWVHLCLCTQQVPATWEYCATRDSSDALSTQLILPAVLWKHRDL